MPQNIGNKRIAKNTLYLYLRTLTSMIISLFASRFLLQLLGVQDYGIYNVVGGVIALVAVLNGAMAGATSRFITYELGKGNSNKLEQTFNSALQIHLGIALIVLLIGETIGLYFLNEYVKIPVDRLYAAYYVYQAALLIAIFNILQVPCRAEVIAHEAMDVFAIIEIINVSLQLGIIFVAKNIQYDHLISYSILMCLVAFSIMMTYWFYSRIHYIECRIKRQINAAIIKPMLSFSAFDLYGNGCVVIQQQGTNLLLNHFFGVALNAAGGIAVQAGAIIQVFVSNITMALRPPMIKSYAIGEIDRLQKLLGFAMVICIILLAIVMVPLYFDIDVLMKIWLVDVPPYAVSFCKIILFANSISVINVVFNTCLHATGNIKFLNIINGTLFLLVVPISWFCYHSGANPEAAYYVFLIIMMCVISFAAFLTVKQIPQLSLRTIIKQMLRPLFALSIAIPIVCMVGQLFSPGLLRLVIVTGVNIMIISLLIYIFWIKPVFNGSVRAVLNQID